MTLRQNNDKTMKSNKASFFFCRSQMAAASEFGAKGIGTIL